MHFSAGTVFSLSKMYTKLTHFFGANNSKLMNILIEYIGIGTAPPNVAIWDKFSE